MITESIDHDLKSKGSLQSKVYFGDSKTKFGDDYIDIEDPLNADLILANIALDRDRYDAFKNIRSGINTPEQK